MDEHKTYRWNTRLVNYGLIVLIFVAASIYFMIFGGNAITLEIGEEALTLGGPENTSLTVDYSDITDMQYLAAVPEYEIIDVVTSGKLVSGTCSVADYGTCQVYLSGKIDGCIVMQTVDGTVLFNFESTETTSALFENLRTYAAEHA